MNFNYPVRKLRTEYTNLKQVLDEIEMMFQEDETLQRVEHMPNLFFKQQCANELYLAIQRLENSN